MDHAERMCRPTAARLGLRPPSEVLVCSTGLIGIPFPIEVVRGRRAGARRGRARPSGGHDGGQGHHDHRHRAEGGAGACGRLRRGRHGQGRGHAGAEHGHDAGRPDHRRGRRSGHAAACPSGWRGRQLQPPRERRVHVDQRHGDPAGLRIGRRRWPRSDLRRRGRPRPASAWPRRWLATPRVPRRWFGSRWWGRGVRRRGAAGARAIARSQLTKCSWFGEDPYWGRIGSDLGSAGIAFDADRFSIAYGGVVVAADGVSIGSRRRSRRRPPGAAATCGSPPTSAWATASAFVLTNDLTSRLHRREQGHVVRSAFNGRGTS